LIAGTAVGPDAEALAFAVKPLDVKMAISSLQLLSTYIASWRRSFTTIFCFPDSLRFGLDT
jgi:hypothetical protein